MCPDFCEQKIEHFDEIDSYRKKGWMYRGQREAKWALSTSLERTCMDFRGTLYKAEELEDNLWREFRRRYHHYSIHIPDIHKGIEWLSLMQHHGAPTRLLDWTYSIYVALYFAIEKQSDRINNETTSDTKGENANNEEFGDHAVWAMDADWCMKAAIRIVKQHRKEWKHLDQPVSEDNERDYSRTFLDPPYLSLAYPINPFRLSERLVLQKGVFVIPGDVSKPFEENLCSLDGCYDPNKLVKLKIPEVLRKKCLERLNDMNITRANLFPGLDGFAQSLAIYPAPPALYRRKQ